MINPIARKDLIVESLAQETLVYDSRRQKMHCLNPTLTWIWEHCDGSMTPDQMAELWGRELNEGDRRSVVWLGLAQLQEAALLEQCPESESKPGVSRRDLAKRLAATSFLLPVIESVIAPTPAMASSRRTVPAPPPSGRVPPPFPHPGR